MLDKTARNGIEIDGNIHAGKIQRVWVVLLGQW